MAQKAPKTTANNRIRPVESNSQGSSESIKPSSESLTNDAQQLSEIRQLLFGDQTKELKNSIDQLSQNLSNELNQLSERMEADLSDFQHEVNCSLKKIVDSQQADFNEHEDKENTIQKSILELSKNFIDYQESDKKEQLSIENALREEISKLQKELEKKHHEAIQKLEQSANELKDTKADKNTLATMLSSMATNLQEQKS
jgi:DNA repair exonuclease SbcCD ATPase subunit